MKTALLSILILFNLTPTAFAAVIDYKEGLIPQIYFEQYYISKPIDKQCLIGKEQQAISNYAEINIDPAGQTQMGVCLARKSQREQLQETINRATAASTGGEITQPVRPYTTSIQIPCQPIAGGECPSVATPAGYIARLYQFGLMIAGLAAFGAIVFGSVKYILSAGSITNQQDAKDQITQAILGLILLLGSFIILYTINPNLVNLTNPNLEVIDIEKIIGEGEVPIEEGAQKILTGGGGEAAGGNLCKLSVNAQIDFNINANTNIGLPDVTPLFDASGVKLPSGTQATGFKCLQCKDNATKDSTGTCACTSNYLNYKGECILTTKCLSEIGTAGGPGGTLCVEEKRCELPEFTRNLALGGICTKPGTRGSCPAGSVFVSTSAEPELTPSLEKGYCKEQ